MSTSIKMNGDGTGHVMFGSVKLRDFRVQQRPTKRKRGPSGWKFSPEMLRLREIEDLIRRRHDGPIPDPEDTDDRETCLAYIRAAAFARAPQDMAAWCRVWARWATEADLVPILAAADRKRRMMKADGVAGLLCVTMAERTALGFRTIGACDMTKAERLKLVKSRKRERDRLRQEHKRRAEGVPDRKSHEAQCLKASKPWEAEGISRATWFRRRRETPTSRLEESKRKGDFRVSRPVPSLREIVARLARDVGPGDHPPAEFQEAEPHGSRYPPVSSDKHQEEAA